MILFGNFLVAKADIAPPISPPGSDIKTNEQVPIRMIKETVLMEVQSLDGDEWLYQTWMQNHFGGHHTAARVTAEFHMRNRDEIPITTDVWFPLTSEIVDENRYFEIIDLRVFVNEQRVGTDRIETPNLNGVVGFVQPWASFQVTFPPKEKLIIRVEYAIQPQSSPGNWTSLSFSYIFQTGAGWYGTIGEATLTFRAPYKITDETIISLPPDGKVNDKEIVWTWQDFEPRPDDDFSIRMIVPDFWHAVKAARDDVNSYPDDADAWIQLADAYQEIASGKGPYLNDDYGRYFAELGIDAYGNAVALRPNDPTPHIGLAQLLLGVYEWPNSLSQAEIWQVWEELNTALLVASKPLDRDERESVRDTFSWLEFRASDIDLTLPTLGPSPTHGPSITPKPSSTPKPTFLELTPTARSTETQSVSTSPTQTKSVTLDQVKILIPTNTQTSTVEAAVEVIPTEESSRQETDRLTNPIFNIGLIGVALICVVLFALQKMYRK